MHIILGYTLAAIALLVSAAMTAYVCASLYTHLGVLATAGIGAVLEGGKVVIMSMGRIPLWMRLLGVFLVFTSATASVAGLELAGAKQGDTEAELYRAAMIQYAQQAAEYETAATNRKVVSDGLRQDAARLAEMGKLAESLRQANHASRAADVMADAARLRRDMDKRSQVLQSLPQPPELPAEPRPPEKTTPVWRVVAYAVVALLIEAMAVVGFWVTRRGRPRSEYQRLRDAVIAGQCDPTSRGVRTYLCCSQSRAMTHIKQLRRDGLAKPRKRQISASKASPSSATNASTTNEQDMMPASLRDKDISARVHVA